MNKKKFGEIKDRVEVYMGKWISRMRGGWTVYTTYHNGPIPDDKPPSDQRRAGLITSMTCQTRWEYATAWIKVSVPALVGKTDDDIEEMVVHELMHVHVHELRQNPEADWIKHEERVCTLLARSFLATEREAKEETRKEETKKEEDNTEPTVGVAFANGSTIMGGGEEW